MLESLVKSPFTGISGWRYWYDTAYRGAYRVQKHEKTGSARLVGPGGTRSLFPTEEEALAALPEADPAAGRHFVLIVPGLNNFPLVYVPLREALRKAGYRAEIWDYPSNHTDVRGHSERLSQLVSRLDGTDRISFVTHSLGGLIVRAMLGTDPEWLGRIVLDAVVMIAPPHRGSFVADYVRDKLELTGLYVWSCGAVGHALTSMGAAELPPLNVDVGVIVGGSGNKWGFSPLAGEDNDGWVTLASSDAGDGCDLLQIRGWPHTLIMWSPALSRAVLSYLKDRRFAAWT